MIIKKQDNIIEIVTFQLRLIDYFFNPDTKYNFNDILPRYKKAE
ncbi:MAG TPA: hypothetical protein P5543_01285 [Planctomycetota bacterium]|nr:hypothetical protein [Planctomycetota bacterium]